MTAEAPADAASVTLLARGKLNLSLRVLAREDSGYHSIETLLVRLELADEVALELSSEPGIELDVTGEYEAPADASNLCWQAAEALGRAAGYAAGVRIRLRKEIPVGAGLGGGSADAAAVLRGLNHLLGDPVEEPALVRLAGRLGSDVPFCLCGAGMALAWERGRRLLPLEAPPRRPVLIVVPDFPIGAGQAYQWLAEDRAAGLGAPPGPALLPTASLLGDPWALADLAINDLEGPVLRRYPRLAEIRESLSSQGAAVAVLCGSGSCMAGVFDEAAARDRVARGLDGSAGLKTIRTSTARQGVRPKGPG
jgi:4-diphosphocytidyl-2-C-methyl-D-erythritol kinase